jgi:uncharacterized glyoxalase superfamily protein PhnB
MNRSLPPGPIIPTLAYADVREAATWLCDTFGFTERLRIGDHRVQLLVGSGSMVVTQLPASKTGGSMADAHSVMVPVADVRSHHDRAVRCGARIINPPTDHPYGERQYSVEDIGGHRWTFTQTIADVDPKEWGGEMIAHP